MRILIQIVLWLAAAIFGLDGGLGYLASAAKGESSFAALASLQIAVIALGALGVMHTLTEKGSGRARQEPPKHSGFINQRPPAEADAEEVRRVEMRSSMAAKVCLAVAALAMFGIWWAGR